MEGKIFTHLPVLGPGRNPSVYEVLQPAPGETVVDLTVGLGGHAAAFLRAIGSSGRLIGLDADATNLAQAREALASWDGYVELVHANFRDLATLELPSADILFADLGLSSPHVDDPDRGFSFRADAPLDLRFDRSQGQSAAAFVNTASEQEITDTLRTFGEVRASRAIARAIVEERRRCPIESTAALRAIVEQTVGWRATAVLPQVFQALRISVNDELGALDALLKALPGSLKPGGRCGIISYHSLEDRRVKRALRSLCAPEIDPETGGTARPAGFQFLTKKSVVAGDRERSENPRSRSARFRAVRKL